MRSFQDRLRVTGGILALLAIGFYYNAYRYPLQINDSGTSPTYSDTPGWLSGGKYVLISAVFGYLILLRFTHRGDFRLVRPFHILAYLFLAGLPILSGVVLAHPDFILLGMFFLLPVILHLYAGWRFSYASANRFLTLTIWIALLVEAVQVALFAFTGRLPALAYDDSISVRFGSITDDPNGFGLLLSWLTPFAAVHFRGLARVVAVGLLIACVVLAQSLTALGAFVGACSVLAAIYVWENPKAMAPVAGVATTIALVAGGTVYAFWTEIVSIYELYMLTKEGSIAGHSNALTIFEDIQWINLAGVQPLVERWEETGYFNILAYFGVVYVGLYIFLALWAAVWYVRLYGARTTSTAAKHFAFGAVGLLLAVLAGNLLLPVVTMFPLDMFTALLMGLASSGIISAEGPAQARIPAAAPAGSPLEAAAR